MKWKRWCILCFVILFINIGYQARVRYHRILCTEVEDKTTTLDDLCFYGSAGHLEKGNILYEINTSEITGVNKAVKSGFEYKRIDYFYSTNVYNMGGEGLAVPAYPTKVCSPVRPVLYRYELFEYEEQCYIKVYYVINHNYDGYSAVYVYDNLDVSYIKEALNKDLEV